jgi:hypothetical protein
MHLGPAAAAVAVSGRCLRLPAFRSTVPGAAAATPLVALAALDVSLGGSQRRIYSQKSNEPSQN